MIPRFLFERNPPRRTRWVRCPVCGGAHKREQLDRWPSGLDVLVCPLMPLERGLLVYRPRPPAWA